MNRKRRLGPIIGAALAMTVGTHVVTAAVEPGAQSALQFFAYHNFKPVTQGPLWPPSSVVDSNGDFIVLGSILRENNAGAVVPIPGAALVSKDTAPPDFSDPLGAPYDVIRSLDLSFGSPDRDMVLYSASMGPAEGDAGTAPRIPAAGDGAFNLNPGRGGESVCPEWFPSATQTTAYHRDSYPLHEVPIWGFQGDQVVYDADSGDAVAAPENDIDQRSRTEPITLGEWARGRSSMLILPRRWNHQVHAFTQADFYFRFRRLPPNAVFSLWFVRRNVVEPRPVPKLPDPVALPSVFTTDAYGRASFSVRVDNPFPAPSEDPNGTRVIGIAGLFHSDYQYWGGCPGRFGSGVDVHEFINTRAEGIDDLTHLVTRPAP